MYIFIPLKRSKSIRRILDKRFCGFNGFWPNIILSAKILRIFSRALGCRASVYGISYANIAGESLAAHTAKIVNYRWLTSLGL
jgi:hypothetical protein